MDGNELAKAIEEGQAVQVRTDYFEVIDGEKWHVYQDSTQPARVNMKNREVWVPEGTTQAARSVVRHEMLHVIKSPTEVKGGMYRYLRNAIEDALVNVYAKVTLNRPIKFNNAMADLFYSAAADLPDRASKIMYDIAGIGSFDYEDNPIVTRTHLHHKDEMWLDAFEAKIYDIVEKGFDKEDMKLRDALTKEVAEYLKMADKEEHPPPPPKTPSQSAEEGLESSTGEKKKKDGRSNKRITESLKESLSQAQVKREKVDRESAHQAKRQHRQLKGRLERKMKRKLKKTIKGEEVALDLRRGTQGLHGTQPEQDEHGYMPARWGEARLLRPPLTLRDPSARFLGRASRPTEEGVLYAYPEREVTDGKVFATRNINKRGGGSLVLDWSGSMSLNPDTVFGLIKAAPRKTKVAYYSGTENLGHIVEVADKGKYADQMTMLGCRAGGGNVIDAQALQWLAKQPGPRIWCSDGYVIGAATAKSESGIVESCRYNSVELATDCLALMERGKIVRANDMLEARLILARLIPLNHPGLRDCVRETVSGSHRASGACVARETPELTQLIREKINYEKDKAWIKVFDSVIAAGGKCYV